MLIAPAEPDPPRNLKSVHDIRNWIVNELSGSLKVHPSEIDTAAPLDSLGIDSLAALGMTGGLAGWLHRDLPATLIWDFASINAIAEGLADPRAKSAACPGVIAFQSDGNLRPVFFFPGQGGHPVTFAVLAAHLGNEQPSYGLIVPGLDGEEKPRATIEEIAATMLQRIRIVQPDGPYQLAGYSFGGLLAYETAQQLVQQGEEVSLLAIYDTFTPDGRKVRPLWQRLWLHAYQLAMHDGRLDYLRTKINRRRKLHQKLNTHQRPSDGTETESAQLHVKAVEAANTQAFLSYRPRTYPGAVLLFRAKDLKSYNVFYKIDPTSGWGAIAKAVRVVNLPGHHLEILSPENSAAAAEALRPYLVG